MSNQGKSLKILVVGGGMYVLGRGVDHYGTILPAILEFSKKNDVLELIVCTTSSKSSGFVLDKFNELSKLMKCQLKLVVYPSTKNDDKAYLHAAKLHKPDAAIVSVPDHLHEPIGLDLIKLGIHILMVKPLADSYQGAKRLCDAAIDHNVIAQVEFHKRLDESNILMRDAVRSRKIGTPLYAVIEYSQQKKIPRDIFKDWSEKTNVFQYLGVHYVDIIYYVTGFVPKAVTAWGQSVYLSGMGIHTYDAMQVVVEWDNLEGGTFVSTHITNWIDPDETSAMSDQKINIVGTKGRYQADQKNRGIESVFDGDRLRHTSPYFCQPIYSVNDCLEYVGYGIKSVHQFLEDVCCYKVNDYSAKVLGESRPTFKQALISSSVIDAVKRSLAHGSVKELCHYEKESA